MSTNEELKTRPDWNKVVWNWCDKPNHFAFFKGADYVWTAHVEPLQAKLDKSESENQKLKEQLKELTDSKIESEAVSRTMYINKSDHYTRYNMQLFFKMGAKWVIEKLLKLDKTNHNRYGN